jgi:nucleoside 2-deoxyribosyltransferase
VRVYVAGSFHEKVVVRTVMDALVQEGHTISHDWTPMDATGLTGEALEAYLQISAEQDLLGVSTAEALVLVNDPKCRATYTELGYALGRHKPVFVLNGHDPKASNLFFHLPEVIHVATLAALKLELRTYTRRFCDYVRRGPPFPPVEG